MRILFQKERRGWLLRVFSKKYSEEIAYLSFRIAGLRATVEFPSDWHEYRRAWLTLGFGLFNIGVSVPWPTAVPDDWQCSGPTYGFYFFDGDLCICHGKSTSKKSAIWFIKMPWQWRHQWTKDTSENSQHPYHYILRSGEVQERTATIHTKQTLWTRPWIPWRNLENYIDVRFNDEVGERTGSWKGGTVGCSETIRFGETPIECLRRMERERKFT